MSTNGAAASDYYNSAPDNEFIRYSCFCNLFATYRQYSEFITAPF